MSLLGKIAAWLPVPVRNVAIRWRDQSRLARASTVPCDPTPLAKLDDVRLRHLLSDPTADAEWPGVAAELEKFEITTSAGGVNPGDRRALYYLVRTLKPARMLEVGTHIGASTVHIAAALRANARGGSRSELVTVDVMDVNDSATKPWLRFGSRRAPAAMLADMGMTDRVRFEIRSSLSYLEEAGDRFDLIFLDGDHSAATVYREVPAALRRLKPGGLVLLHDYFPDGRELWAGDPVIAGPWLGVRRLIDEGARLEVLPLGELRWPTKLGRSVTSLALLAGSS